MPSITVFCKRNNIPDDITGSIFIGTGLSLPVLFVSFVGLFVSNSAIGVGAVVGGNAFNHLVTIACSIWVSPERVMKVDGVIFSREIFFYLVSCLILIWAVKSDDLSGAIQNSFHSNEWMGCLSIPWKCSVSLCGCYVFYTVFESYFLRMQTAVHEKIFKKTFKKQAELTQEEGVVVQSLDIESNNMRSEEIQEDGLTKSHHTAINDKKVLINIALDSMERLENIYPEKKNEYFDISDENNDETQRDT